MRRILITMKKTISILAIIGFILGACSKIDEPFLEPIGSGGENKITVTTEFLDDLNGSFNLNIFIIEDSIVAPQKNDEANIGPTPDWLDYEHNHLLRASLTSTWGLNLVADPTNGTKLTKEYSFGLEDDWNLEKLSFLVFITDVNTFEILQAAEASLTGSSKANEKVILLEEFTGHLCVNCPEATKLAHDYKQMFGEQLLLLSIHAGALAEPAGVPYDADLRSDPGMAIYNHFNPIAVPTGMVNRTEYEGNVVMFKGSWEPAIKALIDEPQQASIAISIQLAE